MADHLLVADAGTVRTLTLDRPEKRNPLSLALMHDLCAALDETAGDPAIAVVVIRGNGPAFSAGHDLTEVRGASLEAMRELFGVCSDLMLRIHRLPQPVIAAVDGIATAAGCQLVAACDLALATPRSSFATPGVRIGLFCSTPMVETSRAVGRKHALEMLLTGDPIDAATAASWGLINAVVPADGLDEAVLELATRLLRSSSQTLAIGKGAFSEQLDRPLPEAYAYALEVMAQNAVDRDAQEGIGAFLEKRAPVWHGRG